MNFGPHGVLVVSAGQIATTFSATWNSQDRPNVTGVVRSLDVNLSSGILDLNADTHLNLTDGHVIGAPNGIQINSLTLPVLTGAFSEVNVGLDDGSSIGFPNGLQVITAAGARFVARDAVSPFSILPNRDTPVGVFDVNLPFRKFVNARRMSFGLSNGSASWKMRHDLNGDVSAKNIQVQGNLTLQMGDEVHSTNVVIADGTLSLPSGATAPTWSGLATFTIPPGVFLGFRTPGSSSPDHNSVLFPLSLRAGVKEAFKVANAPISFDGAGVLFSYAAPTTVTLEVPAGHVDYNDSHNLAGGFKSGNNLDGMQELVTADFDEGIGGCTKHVSLKPASYDIAGKLNVALKDGTLDVHMTDATVPNVAWDDDGCSTILATIAASIAFTPVLGIPAGIIARHFIDRYIDTRLNDQFRTQVTKDWRVKLP